MSTDAKVTRKDVLVYGGAAAGAAVVAGAGVAGIATVVERRKESPAVEGAPIVARRHEGEIPLDHSVSAWRDAERALVPLAPQQIAPPVLEHAGVSGLDVRSLYTDGEIAFLLEWQDDEVDDLDGIRRYHDAVAVQLPARAGATPPAITMGAPGDPVHILQWRATWQRDIDSGGRTGVDQIYPEVVHDVMPDDVLPPDIAQLYWVGREAGNPLSQKFRTTPVEVVVAEGFGSVTHLPGYQTAQGSGVHEDGGWHVVVSLPSDRGGLGDTLAPGTSWPIAFAVWLGSEDNRGGKKHYANWQTLVIEA
jgi:hypothetical protein